MIVEWLLDAFEAAVMFVVGLFPEISFDPVAALADALGYLGDVNYFFPVAELAALVLAFLAVGAPLMLVTLALWVLALIRGGSARG